MIKVTDIETAGWKPAFYAMRLPKESHHLSDSKIIDGKFVVGEKDHKLCMSLVRAGQEHRKHLRLISVWFTIEMPGYMMKEFDTYKVGTNWVTSSTMHMLGSRELTEDDFEFDDSVERENTVIQMNKLIKWWKVEDEERIKHGVWRSIIQDLPMSFKYRRTCTANYEVLRNMYHQRSTHRLVEWKDFFDQLLKELPYPEFITT